MERGTRFDGRRRCIGQHTRAAKARDRTTKHGRNGTQPQRAAFRAGKGSWDMKDDKELRQSIAELIRLHDDVLAHVFAMQTLLQDLDLISSDEVERRTEQFRKQFASDLEARLAVRQRKSDSATEIQRRQQILDEYEGP
jgi:hypothetical protein